jgi:hypothetical protein
MENEPGEYRTAFTKQIHAEPIIIWKHKDTKELITNNNVINKTCKSVYVHKSELKQ